MQDPISVQPPYWYQQGKHLRDHTLKQQGHRYQGDTQFNHDTAQDLPFLHGYHEETVANGATSNPIYILEGPGQIKNILTPAAGTGRVEFTISPTSEVVAGQATWVVWGKGEVAVGTEDFITRPVTAIRVVATGGNVKWQDRVL